MKMGMETFSPKLEIIYLGLLHRQSPSPWLGAAWGPLCPPPRGLEPPPRGCERGNLLTPSKPRAPSCPGGSGICECVKVVAASDNWNAA